MYSVIKIQPKEDFGDDFPKGKLFSQLITPIMGIENISNINTDRFYAVYIWITNRNQTHLAILFEMIVHHFMFEQVDIQLGTPASPLRQAIKPTQRVPVFEFVREDAVTAFKNETMKSL